MTVITAGWTAQPNVNKVVREEWWLIWVLVISVCVWERALKKHVGVFQVIGHPPIGYIGISRHTYSPGMSYMKTFEFADKWLCFSIYSSVLHQPAHLIIERVTGFDMNTTRQCCSSECSWSAWVSPWEHLQTVMYSSRVIGHDIIVHRGTDNVTYWHIPPKAAGPRKPLPLPFPDTFTARKPQINKRAVKWYDKVMEHASGN